MDKKTFLSELKRSLSVLQEEELQDIISEYEQHIDLKVENGLSEEEAIADFGSLADLKAEILEAYHVRADFNAASEGSKGNDSKRPIGDFQKKGSRSLKGFLERMRRDLMRAGKMVWEGISVAGRGIWKGVKWGKRQICRPFMWIWRVGKSTEEKGEFEGKQSYSFGFRGKGKSQEKRNMERTREKEGDMFHTVGRVIGRGFHWCISAVIWCIRLGWNIGSVLASLLVGAFGLFCLYGLGILAVLLPKGYPLLGITIGCLGMVLCLFSLTGFGFTLLWRSDGKGKKDRERPEGIRGDENQDIEGFGLEVEGEQHA